MVSLDTFLAIGAHDSDKIKGNVQFRLVKGDEVYVPLGEIKPVKINKGEYACVDEEKILCRMDMKQCEQTKVTIDTKHFIVYAQGNKEISEKQVKDALKKTCETIIKYCGGEYQLV